MIINLPDDWILYAIIIVIFVIIAYKLVQSQRTEIRGCNELKRLDGNGNIYKFGRGSTNDDVDILLKRIYWSTYLYKRISKVQRIFLLTICISIAVLLFIYIDFPSVFEVLVIIVIVFMIIYMFNNFMYVHADIHNDSNVRNNIRILAQKLNLNINYESDPPDPTSDPVDRVDID